MRHRACRADASSALRPRAPWQHPRARIVSHRFGRSLRRWRNAHGGKPGGAARGANPRPVKCRCARAPHSKSQRGIQENLYRALGQSFRPACVGMRNPHVRNALRRPCHLNGPQAGAGGARWAHCGAAPWEPPFEQSIDGRLVCLAQLDCVVDTNGIEAL
eukprot:8641708-Pyramimonas_sp.AAC.2